MNSRRLERLLSEYVDGAENNGRSPSPERKVVCDICGHRAAAVCDKCLHDGLIYFQDANHPTYFESLRALEILGMLWELAEDDPYDDDKIVIRLDEVLGGRIEKALTERPIRFFLNGHRPPD